MGGFKGFIYDLNPWNVVKYTQRCYDNFGKFVTLLITQNFICKGLGRGIMDLSYLPYYSKQGYASHEYQLNKTISNLPQSLKSLMGVVADCLPLFGYQKSPYMIITSVISTICAISITFLPYSVMEVFFQLPALLFLGINFQITCHELLCQGKFVEKMQEKPHTKSDLVSIVWLYSILGAILPSLTVGVIADNIDVRYLYILLIPICFSPIIVVSYGCMTNDTVPKHKSGKWDVKLWWEQWPIFILALFIGCTAIASLFVGIFTPDLARFIYALVSSGILGAFAFLCLPPLIAKANLYIFLSDSAYLDITGVLDYFYTATPVCLEGGPHFDYAYYRTYTATLALFAELFGLFLFQTIIVNYKLRTIYWISTIMKGVACLFDIIMIQRWNVAIGIPDKVMYLFGNAIVYKVIYQLEFMPTNLFIAKLCPKNVESTVYSILVGFSNYGVSLASYIGLYFTNVFGVYAPAVDSPDCNFDNLSWLTFLCHAALPLLFLPLILILVPNVYLNEKLVSSDYDVYKSKLAKMFSKESSDKLHQQTTQINDLH